MKIEVHSVNRKFCTIELFLRTEGFDQQFELICSGLFCFYLITNKITFIDETRESYKLVR